jgi:hypothetical protein
MDEQVTVRPTKEDFLKFIEGRLAEDDFVKDAEKLAWRVEREVHTPGSVVVVNGQRHDEPGQTIHVISCVEVYGEGVMKDVKTEMEDPFIEVDFWQEKDGVREDIGSTFCMYYDDQNLFNIILNKFFGL